MQQTHYDTLKVSRDAPIEVIRAAYRVLSQKYHPDRHPADSAAADTMGLLNKAYEVLSDPNAGTRTTHGFARSRRSRRMYERPKRRPRGPHASTRSKRSAAMLR